MYIDLDPAPRSKAGKEGDMGITRLIKALAAAFALIAGACIFFSVLSARAAGQMHATYEARREFAEALHGLRSTAQDLTRAARTYAVTGGRREGYFERLDGMRYLDEFRRLYRDRGALEGEVLLARRIAELQAAIRGMDALAIEARDGGGQAPAVEIAYSPEYIGLEAEMAGAALELHRLIEARARAALDEALGRDALFRALAQAAAGLLAALCVAGTALILRAVGSSMRRERKALSLAKTLLDSAPFAVGMWDDGKSMVSVNAHAEEMFGIGDRNLLVEGFLDFSPEIQPCGAPSREEIARRAGEALREGRSRFEWAHLTADGEPLPVEITMVRVSLDGRDALVSYARDLREIKASLAAAREAEERAALMLDATPLACFLFRGGAGGAAGDGGELEAIDCNPTALEMFGFGGKPEALARWREIFPDPPGAGLLRAAAEGGAGRGAFELALRRPGGEAIPCEATIVRADRGGEPMLAGYLRDLREERRLEAAEEESRAKSRFLARMSHEIRTPMNAVLGITEMQLRESHPPGTEEAFLRIQSSSNLLLAIINDILDLSKVEAGKMEIAAEPYELASMIVDTAQLNAMRAGGKRVGFSLEAAEGLPSHLVGDELRVKQILNNLLSNAFKYTEEGSVSLSVSAEPLPGEGGRATLVLRVGDTGQGMTREQISALFEIEFERFNLGSNRAIEGSGLGMTIVRRLVDLMGGEIRVESEPGRGSAFTVRIPQGIAGPGLMGRETAENLKNFDLSQRSLRKMSRLASVPMPYGRVLVVDDVESNLYVAKGILAQYRLAVETAGDGREAVEKIRAGEEYDIIFMDHMMPGMDGIQATKAIRALGYARPIIALTANVLKGMVEMFLANGFTGFVPKPIDLNQIHVYLLRYIRDRQPPGVLEAAEGRAQGDGGEPRAADCLRASFLRDARKAIAAIEPLAGEPGLGEAGLPALAIQAHSMKSALQNVGRPAGAAIELEAACRAGDAAAARASAGRLLAALRGAMGDLGPCGADPGEGESESEGEDLGLLESDLGAVASACERLDADAARSALEGIRRRRGSERTREVLRGISASVLYGDLEGAAALAARAASATRFMSRVRHGPAAEIPPAGR